MRFALFLTVLVLTLSMAEDFTLHYTFDPTSLQFTEVGPYTSVFLPATPIINEANHPSLPVMNTPIAIPAGTRVTDINVVSVSYNTRPGKFTITPATKPVPISLMSDAAVSLPVPDPVIYSSDEFYPASVIGSWRSSMLLGYPVAFLTLHPVRWNPASKELQILEGITLEVTVEETTDNYSVQTRSAQTEARTMSIVKNTVINPDMVQPSGAAIIPSQDLKYGEYVVIVTPEYKEYAEEFADLKTRKGVPTSVYTTTWIDSQYACYDIQQEIRAFLTDCRDYGVEYVLIFGDDDVIAGRDVRISFYNYLAFPPVDLYWSDINELVPGDDQWDSSRDGTWGEWHIDNVDYNPDMLTGRASVNTPEDAAIFIEKVLAYEQLNLAENTEKNPIETRVGYTTGLLWGDVTPKNYGCTTAEIISNMRPSDMWEEEKCYEYTDNNDVQTTIDMINAGPAHIYHSSHGAEIAMYTSYGNLYYVSDIMEQTNISSGHLPAIWNTISCLTGHFDSYESCSDAWLNNPNGGGFGCFNARYGWGYGDKAGQGPSEVMVQGLYKTHWVNGNRSLGAMHSIGRTVLDPYNNKLADWCVKEYNLFGDPELPLWTSAAEKFTTAYPTSIGTSSSIVTVTVTDTDGAPVTNARVCLWKGDDWAEGEVYVVAETDPSGTVSIPVSPATAGEMLVTVWAHNCITHLGSINVKGSTNIENGRPVEATYVTAMSTPSPNPAKNNVVIPFSVANSGNVTVQIFDLNGRTVAVPANRDFTAGQHTINWNLSTSDGTTVPNGFYSVVVTTGNATMVERLMILR